MTAQKPKLFVLDTNVLMHDPTALYRFQEHNIYLTMTVLEEMDQHKRGMSEVARNVRQVNRIIDDMMAQNRDLDIKQGLPLEQIVSTSANGSSGRLFFETEAHTPRLPDSLPGSKNDNTILGTVIALHDEWDCDIILVSKDINLRIKASVLGIQAEDYTNDKVMDDVDLLFTGSLELPEEFWDAHSKDIHSWQRDGKTYYEITGEDTVDWYPNQFIFMQDNFDGIVRDKDGNTCVIEVIKNYMTERHAVWGIKARNREQNFAFNLLMDPEIDFVSLSGTAGTGKTLLTLAAALAQTMDDKRYQEIIMTRVTVPVGEDIGFLPGTEEEKMSPWMGALMDNLEVLVGNDKNDSWEKQATTDLVRHRIKISSMNFMRGRTFLNKFIILDEAQNLTSKQIKTLITRAGPGTKVVCLGNIGQIDTPYLTETTSGLTYIVERFKDWEHSGHITLRRGERSRLADHATQIL
ncbi:MAG: PhoH family protein [Gammaproteobacteria bacterium]|nr:PhoH family protein [Gammaproteobacteria bacterium]